MKKIIIILIMSILFNIGTANADTNLESINIPNKVFYEFIKSENKYIPIHKMKDVLKAV